MINSVLNKCTKKKQCIEHILKRIKSIIKEIQEEQEREEVQKLYTTPSHRKKIKQNNKKH